MEEVSSVLCNSLWGGHDFGYCYLPAVGSNGGILSIWNASVANLLVGNLWGYVWSWLGW